MSDIIKLLPESLANQIAAGEVVQRPASIVKELLENSVDAGATQIRLLVKEAGKSLIQVIDNGKGMSFTDARMCFERHATSKISRPEDLFAIRTFGFRGEAMASIAAVAQVELGTRRSEDEIGTKLYIEASEVKRHEPAALPYGTSIAVRNLFFNVPARRKFLKSNSVELKHIVEEFERVALANPQIAFSLHQNQQEIYQLKEGNLARRIVSMFGKNFQSLLVPCLQELNGLKIYGYVGKPEAAKKTRGMQYFFVNDRYIRHNYLNHAVLTAYEGLISKDSFPFYTIFIEMPAEQIDINVHPTKTEVKFEDERTLYAIVAATVKQALGIHQALPAIDFEVDANFLQNAQIDPEDYDPEKLIEGFLEDPNTQAHYESGNWQEYDKQNPNRLNEAKNYAANALPATEKRRQDNNLRHWERLYSPLYQPDDAPQMGAAFEKEGNQEASNPPFELPQDAAFPENYSEALWNDLTEEQHFYQADFEAQNAENLSQPLNSKANNASSSKSLPFVAPPFDPKKGKEGDFFTQTPLVLLHQYLVTTLKSGLMLLHIKAAKERIFYERYSAQAQQQRSLSQQLLFPLRLHLSPTDLILLDEIRQELEQLGFLFHKKEDQQLLLEGVPADLPTEKAGILFEETLEQFKQNKKHLDLPIRDLLLRALAQRAAQRSETHLHGEAAKSLIDELFASSNPYYAPDGKKIVVVLNEQDLSTFF
ncbi:DNA mismatch repair endonuclease MutL [Hugenholtzia roseola]|uniref:DNA mismatch repair endonuclease MutL n=1 Tax=Hugenholtzia roseola TaxID=1002 RepID=UPI00047A555F|nr:DNA mismatch repair endonuclease MutL [Hugenholtzia roseola]